MQELIKKRLGNKKGFTLIELIVVIAIIAILAAVLIPRFAGFTDKANKSATTQDAKNILSAVTTLLADNPNYDVSTIDASNADLLKLTGTLKGTLSAVTVTAGSSGGVNFTYTLNSHVATVANGVITGTT